MESIITSVQSFSSYIVPMIILLGLLIFVHELGHFLVAKYFKVRVEVFSLGFGPKIFKFKRGDTVYAISAIPLGGYVKMFGDDPTADVDSSQKAHSFTHKPVGQRIAVVLAGPLMNFFFAILLFMGIALLGEQTLSPKIGDVPATSGAFVAGFRSGDTVLRVNDHSIQTWDDFQGHIEKSSERPLAVEVQRADGTKEDLQVTPKLAANKNVLSWDREVGEIEGLSYSSRASVVGVHDPKSTSGIAGLRSGDVITAIDATKVSKWREVVEEIGKHTGKDSISVTVDRGLFNAERAEINKTPESVTLTIQVPATVKGHLGEEALKGLGIEFPELYLATMEKNSPAARAGLQQGDRIIAINGQEVASFEQVATMIRSNGNNRGDNAKSGNGQPAPPLQLVISRDGERKEITVSPNMKERMNPQGKEERRFEIGIRPMVADAPPSTFEWKTTNLGTAVSRGVEQTLKWTNITVLSFVRLFQAEVSAKNIGGFLSIGQMAKRSWQIGPSQFLMAMAIISINLFILNLLPVPVLDGGHLVFYTIEAVKGAPLSMRKMEIAQQVGLVLLLGLMVFALFNDVTRLFGAHG